MTGSHPSDAGAFWNERYAAEAFAFGTEPNDFLREVVPQLAIGDALCLGDGEGRNGVYLVQCGHRVTTVDLSAEGVRKAHELATQRNVAISAMVADLATWDMGTARWDMIVSVFCHVPSELRRRVHAGVRRGLRPGGLFVLEAYSAANIGRGVGGPQDVDLTVEVDELRNEFDGFEILMARSIERDIHEGLYHNGMSATTQFLARAPQVAR